MPPTGRVALCTPARLAPARRSLLHRAQTLRRTALLALAGLLISCVFPALAFSHEPSGQSDRSDGRRQVEALTQAITTAAAQLGTAGSAQRRRVEETLLSVATARRQLLLSLMEDDPGAVLRFSIPNTLRSTLPAKIRTLLEQEQQLEGTLRILHEDWPAGGRYHYGLDVAGTQYSLHFAGGAPTDLLTGTRVRVRGVRLDSMLALESSGKTIKPTSTLPAPNTVGEQRTLVILVNFADNMSQPYTVDDARNVVFGTTSQFMMENSFSQTWLVGDVVGWFTIALTSTVCDMGSLGSQAQAAAATRVNLSSYARWVYVFPRNACGFSGAAYVGGNPSEAWINGSLKIRTVAHELGHNLGLWHSHALDCGTDILSSSCASLEYGDVIDTMGGPIGTNFAAHYNAFQKERLGWLNAASSPPITVVSGDGTYPLETYELLGTGPKALKILKSTDPTTGRRTWYYVESRQAVGFDSFLAADYNVNYFTNVPFGVLLRQATEGDGDSSELINLTPDTSAIWDPALVVGRTFSDAAAGVAISPVQVTASGATVVVQFQTAVAQTTGSSSSPTVTVATDQSVYTRTQSVSITTTVSSAGMPVAGAAVTFTVTKPSGTTVIANGTTGTNGVAVYKLRLKRQDPLGTYGVSAVARMNSQSSTASTTFGVQ